MTALPEDVAALLAAVVDGLTVPHTDQVADVEARTALLEQRASDVRVIVDAVLKGDDPGNAAAHLREWIDQHPVTYTPYVPREDREAGR